MIINGNVLIAIKVYKQRNKWLYKKLLEFLFFNLKDSKPFLVEFVYGIKDLKKLIN